MEYFEPDSRWELYQVTTKEEYVDKFVVKGKFHSDVPTDIQDAWQTVEYLLAHAYYYWPMYDEGFKKALLIVEMAVRFRAKELGVSLKKQNNSDSRLVDIINDVFQEPHFQFLKDDINRARKIRNSQFHPDSNSYMGGLGNMVSNNLKLIVIVLNDIFKSSEEHKTLYQRSFNVSGSIEGFENALLVLEYNKPSILIDQILGFKIIKDKLYLFLNPIRNNISEILSHHYNLYPKVICLSEYEINSNGIKGITPEGDSVRIFKTNKKENLETHKAYLSKINRGENSDWRICLEGLKHNTSWKMVELEYEGHKENELGIER